MTNCESTVRMARQPIYNKSKHLVGYELLYRRSDANSAGEMTQRDSAQALVNSLVDIGLSVLAGTTTAFVNVDQFLLESSAVFMFPAERVVLEIIEDVEPTPKALDALAKLCSAGYKIALDDFEMNPRTAQLIHFASIVKLDVAALGGSLYQHLKHVRKPGIKLLGEKIETKASLDLCQQYGMELFQGYYFSKPEIVTGKCVPASRILALQLVAKLQSPNATLNEIEKLIESDVALSFRLLKLVKSAQVGLSERAASIHSALMFLGTKTVVALATVLALAAHSDKPTELLVTALTRAKMCELLTPRTRTNDRDHFFIAGLFSVLDALLDLPMNSIVEQLALTPEVESALIDPNSKNEVATALRTVVAFEAANWDLIDFGLGNVDQAYYSAAQWAQQTASFGQMNSEAA